jgi:hypothetical protein
MNRKQKIVAVVASGVAVVGIGGGVVASSHHSDPNAKVCADYASMKSNLDAGNTSAAITSYHALEGDAGNATNTTIKNAAETFITFFQENNASQASSASYLLGGACGSAGYKS